MMFFSAKQFQSVRTEGFPAASLLIFHFIYTLSSHHVTNQFADNHKTRVVDGFLNFISRYFFTRLFC